MKRNNKSRRTVSGILPSIPNAEVPAVSRKSYPSVLKGYYVASRDRWEVGLDSLTLPESEVGGYCANSIVHVLTRSEDGRPVSYVTVDPKNSEEHEFFQLQPF